MSLTMERFKVAADSVLGAVRKSLPNIQLPRNLTHRSSIVFGSSSHSQDQVVRVLSPLPGDRDSGTLRGIIPWFKSHSDILSLCKDEVLLDVLQNSTVESHKKDNIIIKNGERGDCYYFVLRGCVSVCINGSDQPDIDVDTEGFRYTKRRSDFGTTVAKFETGSGFGEVALINKDCCRTASILADGSLELLVVNRELYNRSIRSWHAKELYEKYSFVRKSVYFSLLPTKLKNQVALCLQKVNFKFGNKMTKQGDDVNHLYFILSGQVKLASNMQRMKKSLSKYTGSRDIYEKKQRLMADDILFSKDICLQSSYDLIGSTECILGIPAYLNTVTVEEEVICFSMTRASFENLVKLKSDRNMALLNRLAILQAEGRMARLPEETQPFELLINKLQDKYNELFHYDHQVMSTIEAVLHKFKSDTNGYGGACYMDEYRDEDQASPKKPRQEQVVRVISPTDEAKQRFKAEGAQFLTTLVKKGGYNPATLSEAIQLSARRYAVSGATIYLKGLRTSQDYVQALADETSDSRTRVLAWRCDSYDHKEKQNDYDCDGNYKNLPTGTARDVKLLPALPIPDEMRRRASLPKISTWTPPAISVGETHRRLEGYMQFTRYCSPTLSVNGVVMPKSTRRP